MATQSRDKGSWAIGGCTLIGVGVGLIYLQTNVLWMMASILIGIGVGLVLASVFSAFQKSEST